MSKTFRIIVDRLKPSFKTLDFYINTDNSINLIFDKFSVVTYKKEGNSCLVVYENHKKSIIGVDHIEIALGDLARALKNPKLQLERLGLFSDTDSGYSNFLKKCLNSQIHVKKLVLKTHKIDEIPRILTIFQPGTLEYIEFRNEPKTRKNLLKIVNLEQMKRARNLKFLELGVKIRVSNGNRFKVYKNEFDVEDIVRLRDVRTEWSKNSIFCNEITLKTPKIVISTEKNRLKQKIQFYISFQLKTSVFNCKIVETAIFNN